MKINLTIPSEDVIVHRNGIEFRYKTSLPTWRELDMELSFDDDVEKKSCVAVVVACSGSSKSGYLISCALTGLSRQVHDLIRSHLSDKARTH